MQRLIDKSNAAAPASARSIFLVMIDVGFPPSGARNSEVPRG